MGFQEWPGEQETHTDCDVFCKEERPFLTSQFAGWEFQFSSAAFHGAPAEGGGGGTGAGAAGAWEDQDLDGAV